RLRSEGAGPAGVRKRPPWHRASTPTNYCRRFLAFDVSAESRCCTGEVVEHSTGITALTCADALKIAARQGLFPFPFAWHNARYIPTSWATRPRTRRIRCVARVFAGIHRASCLPRSKVQVRQRSHLPARAVAARTPERGQAGGGREPVVSHRLDQAL